MTRENLTQKKITATRNKIDPHHKVTITCFVKNKFGEIIDERKWRLSPSYYLRGIKKWFWDRAIKEYEIKTDRRHNHVIAVGFN